MTNDTGRTGRAGAGFWLVAGTYAIVMMGGTLPIPLYRLWSGPLHFGPFGTTAIFAVYALGVLISLVVFASLSDQLGRRPVLLVALVILAVSTALFLIADSLTGLLVARFVFGLAGGVVTATANAALAELARPDRPRAASTMSTVANMGGLGLGSVAAGAVARFASDPTHQVFWWYLIALACSFVAILLVPETVRREPGFHFEMRRPALPGAGARKTFFGVLGMVLASFAVNGIFSSLVPTFVHDELGIGDPLIAAALVSIVFFAALVAQLLPGPKWLSGVLAGPVVLVIGSVVFEAGLLAGSVPGFIVGTVLAGAGAGLIFGRGIGITQRLADPTRRADMVATYFVAAYLGSTVPTLGLGLLNQSIGTTWSTLILFAVIIAVAVVSTTLQRPDASSAPRHATPAHERA